MFCSDYNVDISGDKEACYQQCSPASQPVCGSDGNTYGSRCILEQTACLVRNFICSNISILDRI